MRQTIVPAPLPPSLPPSASQSSRALNFVRVLSLLLGISLYLLEVSILVRVHRLQLACQLNLALCVHSNKSHRHTASGPAHWNTILSRAEAVTQWGSDETSRRRAGERGETPRSSPAALHRDDDTASKHHLLSVCLHACLFVCMPLLVCALT